MKKIVFLWIIFFCISFSSVFAQSPSSYCKIGSRWYISIDSSWVIFHDIFPVADLSYVKGRYIRNQFYYVINNPTDESSLQKGYRNVYSYDCKKNTTKLLITLPYTKNLIFTRVHWVNSHYIILRNFDPSQPNWSTRSLIVYDKQLQKVVIDILDSPQLPMDRSIVDFRKTISWNYIIDFDTLKDSCSPSLFSEPNYVTCTNSNSVLIDWKTQY